MKLKQRVMLVASLAILAAGATTIHRAGAQSYATAGAAGPRKAVDQYKNIQVLKEIPADQLIPTMQFITASLGVECQFCHVQDAFDKDDKKTKQTARKMMEMMFAINKDNFDGYRKVTCYSCHRGNSAPVAVPPVMEETKAANVLATGQKVENAAMKDGNGHTADQLLENYLKAAGGAAAIEKVTSRVMKGTITFGDRNIPIEIFSEAPDKRVSFTHTPDGESITAFNGHEGWLSSPGRPVREMRGPDIDAAAMDADLHFPEHLKGMLSELQVESQEKIGDRDTYFVIAHREGKGPLHLYFDTQSGLLVRLVRFAETVLGSLPTQIDYADYRQVDGVKIPFRWTLARTGGRFTIQLSEVKQNVPIDGGKFARPPETSSDPKSPVK